jgi:hypothetical protein
VVRRPSLRDWRRSLAEVTGRRITVTRFIAQQEQATPVVMERYKSSMGEMIEAVANEFFLVQNKEMETGSEKQENKTERGVEHDHVFIF